MVMFVGLSLLVAPARERGLKCGTGSKVSRNRRVAPARERGLKYPILNSHITIAASRSREGAWIEIVAVDKSKVGDCGRSVSYTHLTLPTIA